MSAPVSSISNARFPGGQRTPRDVVAAPFREGLEHVGPATAAPVRSAFTPAGGAVSAGASTS